MEWLPSKENTSWDHVKIFMNVSSDARKELENMIRRLIFVRLIVEVSIFPLTNIEFKHCFITFLRCSIFKKMATYYRPLGVRCPIFVWVFLRIIQVSASCFFDSFENQNENKSKFEFLCCLSYLDRVLSQKSLSW